METLRKAEWAGENASFSLEQGVEEGALSAEYSVFRMTPFAFREGGLASFNLLNDAIKVFAEQKELFREEMKYELKNAHSIEVLQPGALITRKLLRVSKFADLEELSAEAFFKKYYELDFSDFENLTEEFFASLESKPLEKCLFKVIKILYDFQYGIPSCMELNDDQFFALTFFVMHVEAIQEYNGKVFFTPLKETKPKPKAKAPLNVETKKERTPLGKRSLTSPKFRRISTNFTFVTGREGWRLQRL